MQLAVFPLQNESAHLDTLHNIVIKHENVFVDPVIGFRVHLLAVNSLTKSGTGLL